ncbi:flagellar basal body-associated protein FliL [Caulifigura coniformis]|uniref:Flagellar protein FliL n=1 Tax=Caulifigura coniformis TaxID=2527983 RepID=A0A517SJD7_9PLAN|nr:flagellar basal body-associated FliL family protein [Caulifigura coniformis]QDT56227.1 flagellar basal body-associated protein FliL [Caulifigura coniformis]
MSAKPTNPGHDEQAPPKKGPGLVVWAIVSLVSGAAGFFVPMLLTSKSHAEKAEEHKTEAPVAKQAEKLVVIPFDDIRVNLNEVQPHYLAIKMAFQVDATQEKIVTDLIAEKKVPLKSWLLIHLGDKDMDDVRGGAGKNMLKREILERFNSMLFTDGYDRIYDVLFEDFMIQ